MSKRQKKKAPVVEEGIEVEVVTKTEYIYMRIRSAFQALNPNISGEISID